MIFLGKAALRAGAALDYAKLPVRRQMPQVLARPRLLVIGHYERPAQEAEADMPSHLFSVGQQVSIRGHGTAGAAAKETYRITATMPARGNQLQYRIRSESERYERVTTEDLLVQSSAPAEEHSIFRS